MILQRKYQKNSILFNNLLIAFYAFRTAQIGHLSDGVIQTFLVYPRYGIFIDSWQEEVIIMKIIVSTHITALCGNYGILLTHNLFSVIKTHVLAVDGVDWLQVRHFSLYYQ